jgi:pimeloyl-ACP methyl ester carboxylesterase/predicted glycosyltransferase
LSLVESSEAVGYRAAEQSRARYPDGDGFVTRDGVRIHYEVFGDGGPAILLMPTWTAVHSRMWKMQVPYLSRYTKVVTFDGRGNGRSDRPKGADAYGVEEFAADGVAVMDATDTSTAIIVAESCGALWSSQLAADHPDRVEKIVYIAPAVGIAPNRPERARFDFDQKYEEYQGWAKYNRHYWVTDYLDFLRFFFDQCFSEPHSSKAIEDCIRWALETTPETLVDATQSMAHYSVEQLRECLSRIKCPALVIHGSDDLVRPATQGAALADAVDGRLVLLEGSGHIPQVRDPVRVNLLLRDFACPTPPPTKWTRGRSRRKRVLFVSSPIGLGHAQRDVAIARALREERPGLEVEWLAQDPVTRVLESHGETVHPASAYLASESGHFESESAEHDLHCFQAWRRMDEILLANFMVFHDVARDDHYDLWIGDEAWELDYFLHENPELKSSAYAWLTDFVGWLPMSDGGDSEIALTSDYNAEMIEHVARFPRLRDRALFVGEPDDIVGQTFGPELPDIRQWTEEHYSFAGYVTGFDQSQFADREALRDELGYRPDEKVCFVTVGGTGVGASLLKRVIASFPFAEKLVPGLRMIVVTGPRIDPGSLEVPDGMEVRAFVPDLYRHLAACDVAVVQGGLSTAMELTANRRPFLYFPLRHHFEQNFHVRHRLERYGAGRPMDFGTDGPEQIAQAITDELSRTIDYLPVDPGGAQRAARSLAELI